MSYFDLLRNKWRFSGKNVSKEINKQKICVQDIQSGSLVLKSSIPT